MNTDRGAGLQLRPNVETPEGEQGKDETSGKASAGQAGKGVNGIENGRGSTQARGERESSGGRMFIHFNQILSKNLSLMFLWEGRIS